MSTLQKTFSTRRYNKAPVEPLNQPQTANGSNVETKEAGTQTFFLVNGHLTLEKVNLSKVSFELVRRTTLYEERNKGSDISFEVKVVTEEPKRRRLPEFFIIRRNLLDFLKLSRHLETCEGSIQAKNSVQRGGTNILLPVLERTIPDEIDASFCNRSSDPNWQESLEIKLKSYLEKLSLIVKANNIIKCNESLRWFCLDHNGKYYNHARPAFNEPGLAHAECIHEYDAQARDEIDLKLRDQIILTRVCDPKDSDWWFGKNIGGGDQGHLRSMTVGYFPHRCVRLLNSSSDMEQYFLRKNGPSVSGRSQVSSGFGKHVLALRSRFDSRASLDDLRQRSLYRERVTLQSLTGKGWEYPSIVELCTEFVSNKCVVEGIYRKSCSSRKLAELNDLFWNGSFPKSVNELESVFESPKDFICVASFIKQLFRDLSEPLIAGNNYESMMTVFQKFEKNKLSTQNDEIFVKSLRKLLLNMESVTRCTLKLLVAHLRTMAKMHRITLMDLNNLALVWAPNLFPYVTSNAELAAQDLTTRATVWSVANPMKRQAELLVWFINNADEIFFVDENKTAASLSYRSRSSLTPVNIAIRPKSSFKF